MNNQVNTTEIKITDSIIIKITGQELIDMGHYIGEDLPEQKFNLHINISEQKIGIAPDVDRGSFDPTFEFDYANIMADLSTYDHIPIPLQMNIHIDVDAKKITCFNSKKGIYETETFAEACLEDSMDESDLQEYFEEKYPHHSVNVIFL